MPAAGPSNFDVLSVVVCYRDVILRPADNNWECAAVITLRRAGRVAIRGAARHECSLGDGRGARCAGAFGVALSPLSEDLGRGVWFDGAFGGAVPSPLQTMEGGGVDGPPPVSPACSGGHHADPPLSTTKTWAALGFGGDYASPIP